MLHVLTLIAPPDALTPAQLSRTRQALGDLGAGLGTPDWLAPGTAADLPFDGLAAEQAIAAARAALGQDAAPDLIAQPAEGRRKRLLLVLACQATRPTLPTHEPHLRPRRPSQDHQNRRR